MSDKELGYDRVRQEYLPCEWEFMDDLTVKIFRGLSEDERKMLICVTEFHIRDTAHIFRTSKSDMGRKWLKLKNKIKQNLNG